MLGSIHPQPLDYEHSSSMSDVLLRSAPLVKSLRRRLAAVSSTIALLAAGARPSSAASWRMHVIDDTSKGADGVRLADATGDGLVDLVTGWETGGVTRVYVNPGPAKAKKRWPAVTVGETPDVEDAVFADLDGDGALDVISAAEGNTRKISVHWAPKDRSKLLDSSAWRSEDLPASAGSKWMFCVPVQIDGRYGLDLVCGSRRGGGIGWFEAPPGARRVDEWKWHLLRQAGWTMSLVATDMDGDGDSDILASDRRRPGAGAYWLENPGVNADQTKPWKEHAVGATERSAMFLAEADLDGDDLRDVAVAEKPREIEWLLRSDAAATEWESHTVTFPDQAGTAKGIAVGDIDGDGRADLVFSCEDAVGDLRGVMWLRYRDEPSEQEWEAHDISGPRGIKYDLVELVDLDGDGDLDVLTTEENEINAVLWYENPSR